MIVESVCEEAARLIETDRADQHGHYIDNFTDAANIANTLLADETYIKAEHLPIILFALKMARSKSNPSNRDNLVDAIGYLALHSKMLGLED